MFIKYRKSIKENIILKSRLMSGIAINVTKSNILSNYQRETYSGTVTWINVQEVWITRNLSSLVSDRAQYDIVDFSLIKSFTWHWSWNVVSNVKKINHAAEIDNVLLCYGDDIHIRQNACSAGKQKYFLMNNKMPILLFVSKFISRHSLVIFKF